MPNPCIPAGDWRIEALGVRPSARGKGAGSALVAFALDEVVRRQACGVSLETSDERNVRLYERHGFDVIAYVEAPAGPPIWTMRAVMRSDDATKRSSIGRAGDGTRERPEVQRRLHAEAEAEADEARQLIRPHSHRSDCRCGRLGRGPSRSRLPQSRDGDQPPAS